MITTASLTVRMRAVGVSLVSNDAMQRLRTSQACCVSRFIHKFEKAASDPKPNYDAVGIITRSR